MNNEEQKPHREEVCPGKKAKLDVVQLRAAIEKKNGPEFWRSLEELAGSSEFQEMMHREFPKGASEWLDAVSRRGFLKLMGASMALAGMTACTKQPLEPIVPYVRQPEEVIPGRPLFFATAFTLSGYASPILVESHLYRPTKIEGNAQHPASLGGTDVFAQASILGLYDPDRSQTITYLGDVRTWGDFLNAIRGPLNRDNVYAGAQMAFGQPVETIYKLDAADVIVSLDADFLSAGFPGQTRYARDFAKRRDPDSGKMSRLYVVESGISSTGAKADHRLAIRSVDIEGFARALAGFSGIETEAAGARNQAAKFLLAAGKDLQNRRGSSVVIAGDHQPPAVHALAHAINQALGNVGRTVFCTDPVLSNTDNQTDSLKELVGDMREGKVDLLFIIGGNPAYDAPADFGFADALKNTKIPLRVHLGLYQNETAELCHWHVNEAHYLEGWGDTRAYDGTASIVQPLIAPLYNGKSAYELLSLLAGQAEATGYEIVQGYWKTQHSGGDFDSFWRKSVHDGSIEGTTFQPKQVTPKNVAVAPQATATQGIEINFRRDPSIYDGRFANNGWLQELPKPMSKMTWDNPVLISPAMAQRMGLQNKDVVELELNGKKVEAAVWIQAGHPDNSITVFLGYGRRRAGRAGTGAGFDMYQIRPSATPWFTNGVNIRKTGGTYPLASTQGYQSIETPNGAERPLVQAATLEEYHREPNFAKEEEPPEGLTLYPGYDYKKEPYAWGMAIDLNACVGCNNCIVACQSENNIAIVGKEQVSLGRHMHW